ncbi:MAG: accessory regulator AgrB [Firmicutes bacterium]|nr:accessory regulator AgrB [Bacillota bacterium]
MERYSKAIAAKLALELDYDDDKREVMAYGAFALIQMLISIGLVIICGLIFDVVAEALIISFTASILRKYSGGVHASSPNTCTFLGVVVCVGFGVLIKLVLAPVIDVRIFMMAGIPGFVWSFCMISKLAPVDTPNKPIKTEEKRKRMRKGSFAVTGVYLLIIIISLLIHVSFSSDAFFAYSMCVALGVFWQVFTLTGSGHRVIEKLDLFLHIFQI